MLSGERQSWRIDGELGAELVALLQRIDDRILGDPLDRGRLDVHVHGRKLPAHDESRRCPFALLVFRNRVGSGMRPLSERMHVLYLA